MIVIQFDHRYQRWAVLLLRSLALHEPGHPILCDAVGLDDAQILELHRANPSVTATNDRSFVPATPAEMANRKPFVLREAMDRHPDEPWFCLLDADSLVRRPLDSIRAAARAGQAALMLTDGMWRGRFYVRIVTPSGILMVRRDARELVDRWAFWHDHDEPVDGVAPREWFWDQVTLFLAWCETSLRVVPLSVSDLANDSLHPRATIWSANVPDKEGHFRRFLAEHERQRAAAEGREAAQSSNPSSFERK